MKTRATVVMLLAGALLLGACNKDPYKIQNFGDGAFSNDSGGRDGARDGASDGDTGDGQGGKLDGRLGDAAPPGPDLSYDACIAQVELCNNLDDNCNGKVDEGFDKLNSVTYCNGCKGCQYLFGKDAVPKCVKGACEIASCAGGYIDFDKKVSNGCEFKCIKTGPEICDGIDNDCNKKIDDLPTSCTSNSQCVLSFGSGSTCSGGSCTVPDICKKLGGCKGAKAQCKGKQGWVCNYDATKVELEPCKTDSDCGSANVCNTSTGLCDGVVVLDEKKCDGLDGDCDGKIDDPWNNPASSVAIGKSCDLDATPKKGVCRRYGVYACDSTKTKLACVKKKCTKTADCTKNNPAMTCSSGYCVAPVARSELCNGRDDNCDGIVDNNVVDEKWITVGTFKIFQYEASRPDATSGAAGIKSTGRPCSVPSRIPWASITKESAQAACKRAGARLCTVTEWVKACKSAANTKFPYGNTFQPTTCNGRAYDTNPTKAGNQDSALVTQQPSGCLSKWGSAGSIYDMSGNLKEWVATSFSSGTPAGYEIRGGAFDTPSIGTFGDGLSCTYQLPAPSSTLQLETLGFRCCK